MGLSIWLLGSGLSIVFRKGRFNVEIGKSAMRDVASFDSLTRHNISDNLRHKTCVVLQICIRKEQANFTLCGVELHPTAENPRRSQCVLFSATAAAAVFESIKTNTIPLVLDTFPLNY